MARVSRKNRVPQKTEAVRIWSTAIYARLSNLNNGQETPESLETQIYMLRAYVEQQSELNLVQVYEDNGFTGTNFERPAFEQLMMDVREKKIDCIVVKDLSRFGRNFIEAGYYIADALCAMREYLEDDETELRDMTDAVLEKLVSITDAEFDALELFPDFDE